MKKLPIIIIVLFILMLSACDNGNFNSKSNIISAADLNERENTIISTISEESFVFDYNIGTEYKEVAVWIEKYESGELVDEKLNYMTTPTEESNGTIILATSKARDEEKQPKTYYIGVGDEGKTASANVSDVKSKDAENLSIVSGQLTGEKALNDGEENVLATIAYSNDEYSVSSISNDFYEDHGTHMDELNEYDVVYLFKAKFVKK